MMSQYFITIIKFDYIQKDEYIFQETNKYKNLMRLRLIDIVLVLQTYNSKYIFLCKLSHENVNCVVKAVLYH